MVIPSALALLAVSISVSFLSCTTREASGNSSEQPIFKHAPGSPFAVAGGLGNVVIGDMNNDRKPDLVGTGEKPSSISVLAGTGDGRFGAALSTPLTTSEGPGDLVLGDVNRDGNLDLAFVTHDSYTVSLLLGDGKGHLAFAPSSPIMMKDGHHPHTHGLAMADLNGDGKLDLATVNNADNDISVAFGDGRGNFTRAPATFAVGPSPYPLAVGDVNNDGHPDMVATTTATGPQRAQQLPFSRALTLLLNDGHGSFRSSLLPLRTGQPWFVAIGDLNGDRKVDLVVTHHEQSSLTVLFGDGRGGFTEMSGSPFDFGHDVFKAALADVNRDGKPDVIAAAGDGVRVMLGDGRGGFRPAPDSPFLTSGGTWTFALGDINSDGKIDVVTAGVESGKVSVLLGN